MLSYEKLLEMNGIYDVDFVDVNGYFYRDYKPLNENLTIGYTGYISYDKKGVHILYKKLYYLNYEKYLEGTQACNAEYAKKLVGINKGGKNFEVDISINEYRDARVLYDEYKHNKTLFKEKQRTLTDLYELNVTIRELNIKREEYYKKISEIDNIIYNKENENIKRKNRK